MTLYKTPGFLNLKFPQAPEFNDAPLAGAVTPKVANKELQELEFPPCPRDENRMFRSPLGQRSGHKQGR